MGELQNVSDAATGEEGGNCSVFQMALQKDEKAWKGRRAERRRVGRRISVLGIKRLDEAGEEESGAV
jgi:hypothetical protein